MAPMIDTSTVIGISVGTVLGLLTIFFVFVFCLISYKKKEKNLEKLENGNSEVVTTHNSIENLNATYNNVSENVYFTPELKYNS